MKVAELLNLRRKNWQELEGLCARLANRRAKTLHAEEVSRFAALYRAACADLALADAYQLPPNTVQYLHLLVGRAHNQLYRTRRFAFATWSRMLLEEVPQRIFQDRCVQVAFCLFWGVFLLSAFLAYSKDVWPQYAEAVLTSGAIEELETAVSLVPQQADWRASLAEMYLQAGRTEQAGRTPDRDSRENATTPDR